MKKNIAIVSQNLKGFREADQIIAFLEDPSGESSLPANVRANYERYIEINSMLVRYKQHSAIIGYLKDRYDRSERQARYDIAETQYIFGKMLKVDRAYEIAYLLELSRKNIEIAMNTRNTKLISQALKSHMDIIGPQIDDSDIPDYSKLEPHKYSFVLPDGLPEVLLQLIATGALDLSTVIPSKMLKLDATDTEFEEIRDGK